MSDDRRRFQVLTGHARRAEDQALGVVSDDRRRFQVLTGHARRAEDQALLEELIDRHGRPPWYGWALDQDPLGVAEAPVRRPPRPVARRWAWVIVIVAASVWLAVLYLLATPRSAAVVPREHSGVALAAAPSASLLGRQRPSVAPRSVGPVPSPAAAPNPSGFQAGWATWCAPTPERCQAWGGDAMVGAVQSFTFGDEPYLARVSRGSRSTVVWVVSHCACGIRAGHRTVIDLSPAAFDDLAPLGRGRVLVELEDLRGQVVEDPPPHPADQRMRLEDRALPATDTAP